MRAAAAEEVVHETFATTVAVRLSFPEAMRGAVREVLAGEYEAGCDGTGLRVLDIGANVGAFSLWASHRWPGSRVDAYEPHPGTFPILLENTCGYAGVTCHNLAVYPSRLERETFFSRYAGDGESGLVKGLGRTFEAGQITPDRLMEVPVLHPRELPPADIIKIDAEGAEAEIVAAADFSGCALLLIEFQHERNLDTITAHLSEEFEVIVERKMPWSGLLGQSEYRRTLAGDSYGLLFLLNRRQEKLVRHPLPQPASRSSAAPKARKSRLQRLARKLLGRGHREC